MTDALVYIFGSNLLYMTIFNTKDNKITLTFEITFKKFLGIEEDGILYLLSVFIFHISGEYPFHIYQTIMEELLLTFLSSQIKSFKKVCLSCQDDIQPKQDLTSISYCFQIQNSSVSLHKVAITQYITSDSAHV